MHWLSDLRLPLIAHSGDGAPAADAAPSRISCALVGTLAAPSTTVCLLRCRQSHGAINAPAQTYSTETRTTPERIMPSARAALVDTSMTLPRMNGPRSLMRQCMEWPACETLTMLPKGRVR